MSRKFSDLHGHNHMRAHFHFQENEKKIRRKNQFSPWTVIASNAKKLEAGKMGASYSQIDLVKCWNGNLRLTFNSLYPLERQFVKGMEPKVGEDKWYHFFIRQILGDTGWRRDLLQTAYMRIPDKVVDHFQSDNYDYWESLVREKDFVLIDSGKRIEQNKIYIPGLQLNERKLKETLIKEQPQSYLAQNACYRIPKNKTELIQSLTDQSEITMILTIEGAHALGTDRAENIEVISSRLEEIKEKWEVPIFFLTFAHHFDNRLCGHAHSLPGIGKLFLNQRKHMNEGFRKDGKRILRELLGLNKNLERDPSLGYRILIDVKHMAAKSRMHFYSLVKICLKNGDRIPVIASHCGYSGLPSLYVHTITEKCEKDDFTDPSGKFNAWNINLCDEDVEIIVQTRGLIGISFDQRILGITKKQLKDEKKKSKKRNGIELLWDNIEGMIKSAYANPNLNETDKEQIWKSLTIGSDFEGLIDPIDTYPTALHYELMSNDLVHIIDQARLRKKNTHLERLQSREDIEKWVDDFCFGNAEAFVIENYPEK